MDKYDASTTDKEQLRRYGVTPATIDGITYTGTDINEAIRILKLKLVVAESRLSRAVIAMNRSYYAGDEDDVREMLTEDWAKALFKFEA